MRLIGGKRFPWSAVGRMSGPQTALAVTVLSLACGGSPHLPSQNDPIPDLDRGIALSWQARPTIVQTLRLLNPGLRQGDTLKLESKLRNVSREPVAVNRVVCELDLETTLQTDPPYILCFVYSIDGPLQPGEEATSTLSRRVVSPPGRYVIAIRHLLAPDVWVPAVLTIRPKE